MVGDLSTVAQSRPGWDAEMLHGLPYPPSTPGDRDWGAPLYPHSLLCCVVLAD